jgi:hypothetical protein
LDTKLVDDDWKEDVFDEDELTEVVVLPVLFEDENDVLVLLAELLLEMLRLGDVPDVELVTLVEFTSVFGATKVLFVVFVTVVNGMILELRVDVVEEEVTVGVADTEVSDWEEVEDVGWFELVDENVDEDRGTGLNVGFEVPEVDDELPLVIDDEEEEVWLSDWL